jgi:hypothetical protein
MRVLKFVTTTVTAALTVSALSLPLAAGTAEPTAQPTGYDTLCVIATLPPDGRPLPEVCVPYPL